MNQLLGFFDVFKIVMIVRIALLRGEEQADKFPISLFFT